MGWSKWRKLAEDREWLAGSIDNHGPACYELALGRRRGVDQIVYVGETGNEKARLAEIARAGTDLSPALEEALREGWTIWYRAWPFKNKKAAGAMRRRKRDLFEYPWIAGAPR